ncbi:MAG: GSCFA domain-containing protein [Chitinophagales bacterium]
MNWNLTVSIDFKPTFKPIGYENKLLLFGSCFSEHIGNLLSYNKFQSLSNPFGILYNPRSISKAIHRILEQKEYSEEDLVYFNERWLSFDHHSSFSNTNKEAALSKINSEIKQSYDFLKQAQTIVITFGTAYVYTLKETNKVVGNCHKLASNNFNRFKLSVEDIVLSYHSLIKLVDQINPNIQWLFTVSPIRHWKDGAANNSWSKSTLICAVHQLVQEYDNAHYFPSYEIMMDELRDHRFYKQDLIHPSEQAIEYIWRRFMESAVNAQSKELYKQIGEVLRACSHKPFNYHSDQHQAFIKNTLKKIQSIKSNYPSMSFNVEENLLKGGR